MPEPDTLMQIILNNEKSAQDSRRIIHEKLDEIVKQNFTILLDQQRLDGRLRALELGQESIKPHIDEFNRYKERVAGAGILGRWLWWMGGGVLALAAYVVGKFNWPWGH